MTKSSVGWEPVRYCVDTDTMAVEVRPWPGRPGETAEGEDQVVVPHVAAERRTKLKTSQGSQRHAMLG